MVGMTYGTGSTTAAAFLLHSPDGVFAGRVSGSPSRVETARSRGVDTSRSRNGGQLVAPHWTDLAPQHVRENLHLMREQVARMSELVFQLEAEFMHVRGSKSRPQRSESKTRVAHVESLLEHCGSGAGRTSSEVSAMQARFSRDNDSLEGIDPTDGVGWEAHFDKPGEFARATSEDPFEEALLNGSDTAVMEKVAKGTDPNKLLHDFAIRESTFLTCHPVSVASLLGRVSLVSPLVKSSADPNADYSFQAGGEQKVWSGPAIHAAVPTGNLEMIRELVMCRADLHMAASNQANMVWQAAYFGQPAVLEFLLNAGVEADKPARSQDDSNRSYTPLHAAAKAGHVRVVGMLLDAKASLEVDDDMGVSPLDDAVVQGHAEVVRQLVVSNADLFKHIAGDFQAKKSLMSRQEAMKSEPSRSIDMVFLSENQELLASVADGLASAPKLLDRLSKDDLVYFLNAPGNAPMNILNAIFRPYPIRYWSERNGRLHRTLQSVAFVDCLERVNIANGPHSRVIQRLYIQKRQAPEELQRFFTDLVPFERGRRKEMYVPVTAYMCHIPYLHQELGILLAIADCKDLRVFSVKGCEAVINLKWQAERMGSQIRMAMAFVEVLNLVLLNIVLNGEEQFLARRRTMLGVAVILAAVVWVGALCLEITQALGYCFSGLQLRYATSPRYLLDVVVTITTGVVIYYTVRFGLEAQNDPVYATLLGVLVFLKWMRLLISLRQTRSVGLRILPITTTMWDVGPFVGVLTVYIIGSVNMYYALGINDIPESFFLIYRIVVMGDVDLHELEGVFNPSMRVGADGLISQVAPPQTQYYFVVRVMMVAVSFVMGLSMMNLFVAMLCLSYSLAAENAWYSFMRSRAGIVLDQHAIRLGLRMVTDLFCPTRRKRKEAPGSLRSLRTTTLEPTSSVTLDDSNTDSLSAFIWFAVPTSESSPDRR